MSDPNGELISVTTSEGEHFSAFVRIMPNSTNFALTIFTLLGRKTILVPTDELQRVLDKFKEVLERGKSSR